MKKEVAMRIMVLRPRESARRPLRGLAMKAKKDVLDVMRLLSSVVRGLLPRSVPMLMSVEDMTPVLGLSLVMLICRFLDNGFVLVAEKHPTDASGKSESVHKGSSSGPRLCFKSLNLVVVVLMAGSADQWLLHSRHIFIRHDILNVKDFAQICLSLTWSC